MKLLLFSAFLIAFSAASAMAQTVRIVSPPPQLVRFIYLTTEGKEDIQRNYQGDLKAAARDLIVKAADVDRDGKSEFFVSRKSLCDNNADCPVTLYKQRGKTFTALYSAPQLDVSPGWSEGKRHLISCRSSTVPAGPTADAKPPRCSFLRWYKTEYVAYRCVEAETKKSSLKAKEVPCFEKK